MLKELIKNEIQKLTWNIEDLEKEIQKSKELLLEKLNNNSLNIRYQSIFIKQAAEELNAASEKLEGALIQKRRYELMLQKAE